MQPLVSTPAVAYLFWKTMRTSSLNRCLSQYGRYFSTIKSVQGTQREIFSTASLDSKTQKRFLSNATKGLMDFEVWNYPKPFAFLRGLYIYFYKLEGQKCFSLTDISKSSCKALEVVTTLLSQLKFSELEGLVTPECKQEVEQNLLTHWTETQAQCLAVNPGYDVRYLLGEVVELSDEKNDQKSFVEVRVIHYVWLPYGKGLQELYEADIGLQALEKTEQRFGKIFVAAVFNCKFISEIINGSANQWIMNGINLRIFPGMIRSLSL